MHRVFCKCCSELTLPFLRRAHLTKSLLLSFGRRLEDDGMKTDSMRLDLSSLIQLSRSLTFSRPVSLSDVFMYVVVGLPLAALPCVSTHGYQLESSRYAKHVQIELRVPNRVLLSCFSDPKIFSIP